MVCAAKQSFLINYSGGDLGDAAFKVKAIFGSLAFLNLVDGPINFGKKTFN